MSYHKFISLLCDKFFVVRSVSILSLQWMYIVPVVIFVVLSGAANPDGGAGAGGSGAGR
jgi:hypothetical protein